MRSFAWALRLATFLLVDGYGIRRRDDEGICEISEPRVALVDTTLYWVSNRTVRQGGDTVVSEERLYRIDLNQRIPLTGPLDTNLYSSITIPSDYSDALDSTAPLFADDNSIHFLSAPDSADNSASIVTFDSTTSTWESHRINVTGDTGAYDGTHAVRDPVIGRSFSLGGPSGNALTIFDAAHPEDRAVIENEVDNGAPSMERGNMVEVDYGKEGVLVAFGGVDPTKKSPGGVSVYRDLGVLDVYDISTHKWFTVEATGDIPGNRTDACAVSFRADESQALIYLYGGKLDGDERTIYTDLHVLAVPAFTWIKVREAAKDRQTPELSRYDMECVKFKNRQLVALGGTPLGEADASLERRDTPDTPDSPDTPDDPNSTADEEADAQAAQQEAEAAAVEASEEAAAAQPPTAENTQPAATENQPATANPGPVQQQPESPGMAALNFDTPDTPDSPDTPDDPSTNQDQIIDEINAQEPEEGWGTEQPNVPVQQAPAPEQAVTVDTPDTPDSPDTPDDPSTNQDQIIDEINAQEPEEGWGSTPPTVPVQPPAPQQPVAADTPDTPDSPDTPDDPSTDRDQIIDEINAAEPEEGWPDGQPPAVPAPDVPTQAPAPQPEPVQEEPEPVQQPVQQPAPVKQPDQTQQEQPVSQEEPAEQDDAQPQPQPEVQPAPESPLEPEPQPQPEPAPAPGVEQEPASPEPEVELQPEPEFKSEPQPVTESRPEPQLEEDAEEGPAEAPTPAEPTIATKAEPTPEATEAPKTKPTDTTDDKESEEEPLAIKLPVTNQNPLKPLHTNIACRSPAPPIRILDASTFTWLTDLDPTSSPFLVPEIIFRIIGGDATGGATKTQPSNGWSDPELEWIFKTVPNPGGASTPTPTSNPVPIGVIVGATVGAVAALLLLFCIGLFIYFRRRQNGRFQQMHAQPDVAVMSEKAGYAAADGGVMIGGVCFEPAREQHVELKELDAAGVVGELPQRDHQIYEWSKGAYMHELATGGEEVKFELEAEPVRRVEMEGEGRAPEKGGK